MSSTATFLGFATLHDRMQATLDEHRYEKGRDSRGHRDRRRDHCTCGRWRVHRRNPDFLVETYDEHVREAVQKVLVQNA